MKVMLSPFQATSDLNETIEPDDDQLVRQALNRPTHFAVLYNRHVANVYRYLLSRVGNQADAEDLTSQTFLIAMENLHRYQGKGDFQAWLFRIARNKSIDHYRKGRHNAEWVDGQEFADEDTDAPETAVANALELDTVLSQLKNIAPDRAEVISLRIFGQLETPEIAQTLGKSETAVRMLLHRGIKDLQSRLLPTLQEKTP